MKNNVGENIRISSHVFPHKDILHLCPVMFKFLLAITEYKYKEPKNFDRKHGNEDSIKDIHHSLMCLDRNIDILCPGGLH